MAKGTVDVWRIPRRTRHRMWDSSSLSLFALCLAIMLSSSVTVAFSGGARLSRTLFPVPLKQSRPVDDSAEQATPLELSPEDRERLASMVKSHTTRPIMILDAMVPHQSLTFSSADPKFCRLVDYCLEHHVDLGMIGVNPYTKKPLSIGVCVEFTKMSRTKGSSTVQVTMKATSKRIQVQGAPWLDETASFHLADVQEIVSNQDDDVIMTTEQLDKAQALSDTIPELLNEWKRAVLNAKATDEAGLEARLDSVGPMPKEITDRALWVAAVINPLPALGVALEIRPSMLAARNPYARILLACQSLQSSIDHLSGKKRLF